MVGWVWNEGGDGLMVAGREGVKTNRKHSEKGEFTKVPACVCIQAAWVEVKHTHQPAPPLWGISLVCLFFFKSFKKIFSFSWFFLLIGCREGLSKALQPSSLLTGGVMGSSDGDGGMKVLTWLSAERRGMERVRPCPSTG